MRIPHSIVGVVTELRCTLFGDRRTWKRLLFGFTVALVALTPPRATASVVLSRVLVAIDGAFFDSFYPPTQAIGFPGLIDDGSFDYSTGLGVLTVSRLGVGAHRVSAYFDIDITDFLSGNPPSNDRGSVLGVAAAGQRWEIDSLSGDILSHIYGGRPLDNSISSFTPMDVTMALSWDFVLAPGEAAVIKFTTASLDSGVGLALVQRDDLIGFPTVYFNSDLEIRSAATSVPEPSTLLLVGLGVGAAEFRRRRAPGKAPHAGVVSPS